MAFWASKKYSYWSQAGILGALVLAGLVVGGLLSILPLLATVQKADWQSLTAGNMDAILKPENAGILRIVQFISTLFLFFVPAYAYAAICHKKAAVHLGFNHKPTVQQLILIVALIFFSMFLVGALQELWNMIPFSKGSLEKFKSAEDAYNKQMMVMARMNGPLDLLYSIFIVALLPAVFEETIFRGAFQNLLSRWTKMPLLSLVIVSAIFSYVHGSYDGFLVRFLLGFLLGWLYYRTGNLWLSIAGHFLNNAAALLSLYVYTRNNATPDLSKAGPHFPIWLGAVGLIAVIGILIAFDRVSKDQIDEPGKERWIPGTGTGNPFLDNDKIDGLIA